MSERRTFWLALLGLALTNLFWAINATLARGYIDEVTPIAMNLFRWFGAFLILTPFAWRGMRANWPQIRPRLLPLTGLAAVSIAFYNSLLYLAANFTTTVNITLLNTMIPVFTLIAAWRLLGNRPRLMQIIGMLASIMGVLVILTQGQLDRLLAVSFGKGDLFMLGAVTSWALYTVMLKRMDITLSSITLLYVLIILGLPMLVIGYGVEIWLYRLYWPTIEHLGLFSYLWVFPSILAYLFWVNGVRRIGAEGASLSINLMPIYGAALAITFLGETIHWYHFSGAACSLVGMVLAFGSPAWFRRLRRATRDRTA
ncbi:MAG: DMT family transporter [Motiliproteus sp.]